jgi:PAS domain S-box-containing protein
MRAGFRVTKPVSLSTEAEALVDRAIHYSVHACGTLSANSPANLLRQTNSPDNSPVVPHRLKAALITFDADSRIGIGIAGSRDSLFLAGNPGDRCKQLPSTPARSGEFLSLKLLRRGSAGLPKWGETGIIMHKKPPKPKPDQRILKLAEQFQQRVLESSVAAVGIMDSEGRFLTVSQRGVEITGYSNRELKGKHCTFLVAPEDQVRIKRIVDSVLSKRQSFSKMETNIVCKDGTSKIISFGIAPVKLDDKTVGAVATGEDVTAAKRAEEALRQSEAELRLLSSRLLDLQDSERRRIARELHDGTAQNLFALNIALSRMLQQAPVEETRNALQECLSLCEQTREEIRTLSYVLHPPMLDEAGLVSALKWYIEGFSSRSGIKVELTADPAVGRLPIDIETDLFRVVQECLANIHRHSGSVAAVVHIDRNPERVLLQIRDWGRGMPAEIASGRALASPGVGIPGMHERLGQHQGNLEIKSSNKGTIVTATVPLSTMHRPHDVGRRQ